jgi:hypothetical protein
MLSRGRCNVRGALGSTSGTRVTEENASVGHRLRGRVGAADQRKSANLDRCAPTRGARRAVWIFYSGKSRSAALHPHLQAPAASTSWALSAAYAELENRRALTAVIDTSEQRTESALWGDG